MFLIAKLVTDGYRAQTETKKPTSDPKEWEKLESRKFRVLGS